MNPVTSKKKKKPCHFSYISSLLLLSVKVWRSGKPRQAATLESGRLMGGFLKDIAMNKHGQQCNVTYRRPERDLPDSNPVVSHFFTLIILYREA